ncbi:WhiB family transcriptional regulator [Allokutzneria albata]|uniref:Transcription factor WhiB n=1 Tax=Allokutzneria albata TaxID=211114 RepID=A0A1H0CBB2_ALLAB|nr:WhiB family transcriptional regulator [Allokutzneria albata]SDN55142.1 Transcription factor WhiB [Allokutzneria albata]
MNREWRDTAACRDLGSELFFDNARTDEAKAVCSTCPVLAACRTDQLAWEAESASRRYYTVGVFGGLSGPERNRIHYPRKEVA